MTDFANNVMDIGNKIWEAALRAASHNKKKEKRDRAFLFYDGSHAKISKPTF
jgi:hypothetical protein